MSWILFSLLAAFFWACANIIDKFVLSKLVRKPVVPVILLGILGVLVSSGIALITGVELLEPYPLSIALFAGFCYTLMSWFYFQALKVEEVSRIAPLIYITPLFIAVLAAVFLDEVFTLEKYLGIVLLIIGAIGIGSRWPLSLRFGKGFMFIMLNDVLLAVYVVLTKYLLISTDFWTVFFYTRVGEFLCLIPIILWNIPALKETYRESGAKAYGFMAFSVLSNLGGVLLIIIATSLGPVTLTNTLASAQIFFVMLFAALLSIFVPSIITEDLRTTTIIQKIISILLIAIGAYLVTS